MGRSIGYNYIFRRIEALWKPKAPIDLVALDNDYFIVRFASIDDYYYAKFGGPWMVMDHYLIAKEWSPNFDPLSDNTNKLLIWVRFPCLLVEYYDKELLMKIGRKIGRPIRVDQATSLVSRGKFARICVEVDITKPLLAKFMLRRKVRRIEYEGIHMVCFTCGVYGHHQGDCPEIEVGKNLDTTTMHAKEGGGDTKQIRKELIPAKITKNFGPWMMVSRVSRRFDKNRIGHTEKLGKLDNRRDSDNIPSKNYYRGQHKYGKKRKP
ncbi:uncharacterized protein [Primulina huaijiensis]|uniref:uncharacterized protein n=1 Tax=Primulina huaijiensis TaxID=1492673 RepID=UPI003CC6E43E